VTLVLGWRQPDPPIVTRWRPQRRGRALPPRVAEAPLAAIIGPPGNDGPRGLRGEQGLTGEGADDPGDLTVLFDNRLI
jgi:hypothetical protein